MLIPTTTTAVPAFAHVGGHYQGRPSRALRRRLRTPDAISIGEWARRHRRVTEIDSTPGAWDESRLPHTVEIMDTISLPYVREVYICMPERGGKTQVLLNTMGHTVDQGSKAGNIFWLMPTEAEAKKAMADRIIPVLKAPDALGRPGRLARYLSKYDDDTKRGTIRFNHGIRLFPAWSNSPTSMASYFGVLNIGDEIDKFEVATKEGSDALTLLRKRGRDDLSRSKSVYASTPGKQRKIYGLATIEAQLVLSYHLRCPHCDALINPHHDHLDIDDQTPISTVEADGCNISCPECGGLMDDLQRQQAFKAGRWVVIKGADIKRPETVGFHMSAYALAMVPLKESAIAWLRSKTGKPTDLIAYSNGYLCCDYEHQTSVGEDKEILTLCDDRPSGVVPVADICSLLLTVDTQKDSFYYVLRAHGYGQDQESWLVSAGMVNSFDALDDMLDKHAYFDANGTEYRIEAAAIDTGGSKHHHQEHSRTVQVYNWVRSRTKVYAFKGGKSGAKPYHMARLDHYPNGKIMRGGLRLWTVNSNLYKGELDRRLKINTDDPGAFHLHSGYSARQLAARAEGDRSIPNGLKDYARHMVAEAVDDSGQYQPISGRRHDYRDCENYQIILADILKIKHRQKPEPETAPAEQPKRQNRHARARGSFVTGFKR